MHEDKNIVEIFDEVLNKKSSQSESAYHEALIESFWLFYEVNGRHSYHDISKFIIEKNQKNEDEEVDRVAGVTKQLISICQKKCSAKPDEYKCHALDEKQESECPHKVEGDIKCSDYKRLSRFLSKLYDHIQLERERLAGVDYQISLMEDASKELERTIEESLDRQKALKKEMGDTKKKIQDISLTVTTETKNIYLQVVTILGIFATIVVAVFGGMNNFGMATTALNQASGSVYQTLFILSVGGFFLFNVVYSVLGFICIIHLRENLPKIMIYLCIVINVVCIGGIIYSMSGIEKGLDIVTYQEIEEQQVK